MHYKGVEKPGVVIEGRPEEIGAAITLTVVVGCGELELGEEEWIYEDLK